MNVAVAPGLKKEVGAQRKKYEAPQRLQQIQRTNVKATEPKWQAIAQQSYLAKNARELSFEKGDVINVTHKDPSGTWQGELRSKRGQFPSNLVRITGEGGGSSVSSSASKFSNSGSSASPPAPSSPAKFGGNSPAAPSPPKFGNSGKDNSSTNVGSSSSKSPTGAPPQVAARGKPPAVKARQEKVKVLYDYEATRNDELTLRGDDIINVISKQYPDWWEGELDGKKGFFPVAYTEQI